MKLITENIHLLDSSIEDELNEDNGTSTRNYYLSGIFSTPDTKNRNGRVYSRAIWEREVEKYQKEIKEKTVNSLGEWQHPPRSTIDPMKAVMRITELAFKEDGNVWGRCKILNDNTEITNKLKGLIKEGVKIGISTRGVGKVSATGVVEDFKLITYDAVDMPSDYNAMLNGVVEGYTFENGIMMDKDYRIDENGCVGEVCGIVSESEKEEDEKCPIKEKIETSIAEMKADIKSEIIESLSSYMTEELSNDKKLSDFKDDIIESLDLYLSKHEIEEKKEEKEISVTDKEIAEKLFKAFATK